MIQVPVFNSSASDFEFTISLGGQDIKLHFGWNTRSGYWFLDIDDQQGHTIYSRKLVPVLPVLRHHRALVPIVGDFVLLPEDTATTEYPTFEGLGTTHNLYWLDAAQLAQWESYLGIA